MQNELTKIFARKDLRAHFKAGSLHHPWWWPKAPGRRPEDWGLAEDEQLIYNSLMSGAPARGRKTYEGFLGSVAAGKGCVWLLSIRPSGGTFAHSVPRILNALLLEAQDKEGVAELHVTDLIKFRGARSARSSNDSMTDEMFRISVECLFEEYRTTAPERILIVDSALRTLIERRSPRCPHSDLYQRWQGDSLGKELNSFLRFLKSTGAPVPHWQGDSLAFNAAIRRELSGCKKRIPRPALK